MRESRTFAERTKVLKNDEAKKRYFLIFEGASTEKIYFEALENVRDDCVMGCMFGDYYLDVPRLAYADEDWDDCSVAFFPERDNVL